MANLLTMLYRFAHFEELASRVRPSLRRPGRTVADAEGGQVPSAEEPVG